MFLATEDTTRTSRNQKGRGLVREIPNPKSQIPNKGVSFGPILLRQKIIAAISGYL
jgi:hypothetical protein